MLRKHAEEERIEREVLGAKRRVLSEEHLDSPISAYNLARPLWDQGKHVQAEEMHQTALQDQQHALGSPHPALRGTLSLSLDSVQRSLWQRAVRHDLQRPAAAGVRPPSADSDAPSKADSSLESAKRLGTGLCLARS